MSASKRAATIPRPMTEQDRSVLRTNAALKALMAKTSMLPPNATDAQKRQVFESALATRTADVKTKANSATDTKTGADVAADIERQFEWTELMTEAVRVGMEFNSPFLGLQLALYAAITVQSNITEFVAGRFIDCIQSSAATSGNLAPYINGILKSAPKLGLNIYDAFWLLYVLGKDFFIAFLEQRIDNFKDAKTKQENANKVADFQRLLAQTERCFINDFGQHSTSEITDIVRRLLETPAKSMYVAIPERYADEVDRSKPFLGFEEFVRFKANHDESDLTDVADCIQTALLSIGLQYPASAAKLDDALDVALRPKMRIDILEAKIVVMIILLHAYYNNTSDEKRTIVRAVRNQAEDCFLRPNRQQQPLPFADIGSSAAPISDVKQINPNYGAAGIAVGSNASTYASSIGSAYSALSGRPVIPLDKMVWPPKPTKKVAGGFAGFAGFRFRPTTVRCLF